MPSSVITSGSSPGQVLEAGQIRAEVLALMQVDVERLHVHEREIEVFGCREIRVGDEAFRILLFGDLTSSRRNVSTLFLPCQRTICGGSSLATAYINTAGCSRQAAAASRTAIARSRDAWMPARENTRAPSRAR